MTLPSSLYIGGDHYRKFTAGPGYTLETIRRYGTNCHILTISKITRALITNTKGGLENVLTAMYREGAPIGINVDGWDITVPVGGYHKPLSIAVSDGNKYQSEQYDLRYFLNFNKNHVPWYAWNDYNDLYNTGSGTRALVWDGRKNMLLDTVDRHARSSSGINDSGQFILIKVDGVNKSLNAGCTLSELADLYIERNVLWAMEHDGGSSSQLGLNGSIVGEDSGRSVVQHLLIWTEPIPPKLWRVVYDQESPDWGYRSRTLSIDLNLSQAPAVYGYSPDPVFKPSDYRVDETLFRDFYFTLNDYDTTGLKDGQGQVRCENFLFKSDTALYNKKGFPGRELLTMSGNRLQEIEWVTHNGNRYLKFKTLQPGNNVEGMTHKTHPQFVHRFEIVQYRDNKTITAPKINRNGYLYYYLVSKLGFGFMPERSVKPV